MGGRPLKEKKRVHVLAIGDVGSTLLTGLHLLGGDCISSIGICDISEKVTARWEFEENQIAYPWAYDALPEVGHACGHCLSGSISVLAALALQELQDELDLDVHIIGTPAEETYGAKCNMVEQGIFGQYDMASMVHLYDTNLPVPKLQALSAYLYRFHGRAAHASSAPWEGANAFNGAQLMFHAIDMLRQHTRPDAQFHGVILHGGEAPNKYDLQELVRKVDDCARGAAIATQTTWDKEPAFPGFDNLKANPAGSAALAEVFSELGLPLNGDPEKIFASSDIGNISYVCPSFHPCLQVADCGTALHTRQFAAVMKTARAHQALDDGAKLIALHTAKIFGDEELFQAMKADFGQ